MSDIENYNDRLDFYQRGPLAPLVLETKTAGVIPAKMARLVMPAGDFADPPLPDLTLIIGGGRPFRTQVRTEATHWRGRFSRGDILVPPPSTSTSYTDDDPLDITVISFPLMAFRTLPTEVGLDLSTLGLIHERPFRDDLVSQLCFRLWDEAADDNPLGSVFADGAFMVIAAALARRERASTCSPQRKLGGIAPFRLRRVEDLIDARLHDDLSIVDLADAAGLSAYHFARSFRRETGKSPHEWLLKRRVDRAKKLLLNSDLSVDAIAAKCGFRSRAGFGAAFKRIMGTTPRGWRNNI